MDFTSNKINNKLKGCIAEEIFLLLHLELKCKIYRTGQEFLYPDLFNLANLKKKTHHYKFVDDDLKAFNDKTLKPHHVADMRFQKDPIGSTLAKSPDFTIITPSGNIEQFEVKFRWDGKLSEKDKNKYLIKESPMNIFIVMVREPYIKILQPYSIMELNQGKVKKKSKFFYKEVPKSKDGSLGLQANLPTDWLKYPKPVLKKYEEIIKLWFDKERNKKINDF